MRATTTTLRKTIINVLEPSEGVVGEAGSVQWAPQ
uniref:Uncharacterized protein n=1 Tax=Anguilla anguilla TaxID=7936 RepID=A0A0E9VLA0_ANGAN